MDTQLRGIDNTQSRGSSLQNIQAIIAMVEAGHDVAALPAFVAPACERFNVTLQTLTEPVIPIDFFAVSRKGRQKTGLANALVQALGKHIRTMARAASC